MPVFVPYFLPFDCSGGTMGYKQTNPNMTFAEASLVGSMENNRSLKRLEKINQLIQWSEVEELLLSSYTVGSGKERCRRLSSPDAAQRVAPPEMVPDRLRSGIGEPGQRSHLLQEVPGLVLRSAVSGPFHVFPVSEPSVQGCNAEDQQRCPAAVFPKRDDHQRRGGRGRPSGPIGQQSYRQESDQGGTEKKTDPGRCAGQERERPEVFVGIWIRIGRSGTRFPITG